MKKQKGDHENRLLQGHRQYALVIDQAILSPGQGIDLNAASAGAIR